MRLATTLTGLTEEEWALTQAILRPSYEINPEAVRVCLTVIHGPEERHVELPLGTFVEVMAALGLERVFEKIYRLRTAQAALTPDALPDDLTCHHGAAVTNETPSVFEGAAPVRDFADGCQSYGPYAGENPGRVRQDCAFCKRERNAKDNNHAPDCPYWTIGPGSRSIERPDGA